ncbi:MAG: flagellar basal body rod protein FlgB [Bryobacterales bacterium]|nr:flagellar basal body rod protein FlgB [Bryobacterales bacterium]
MIDRFSQSLEVYMDLLATRQKLVSSNIANLSTPGYRTKDIDFQQHLEAAMQRGSGTEAARAASAILEQPVEGLTVKNDGNDVSLEREARLLAETAMRFQMASMLLERRIGMTKAAIREEVAR